MVAGGAGSAVAEMLAAAGRSPGRIEHMGLPDRFLEHGSPGELLAAAGLTAADIAGRGEKLLASIAAR